VIRTLIVDDEPIARQGLRALVSAEPGFEVIGECGNGRDAVATIRRDRPDLVLLDVQMPDLDGFGLLAALGRAETPAVVFVTAYDEHAVRAFDADAVDYLVKPLERDRVRRALQRVARTLRARPLVVAVGGGVALLDLDDVCWIEARGNYVRIHTTNRMYLVRETLKHLESRLPAGFVRIGRSAIVNLERVAECHKRGDGRYDVVLRDGTAIVSSRRYAQHLKTAWR
jgi:two-component system LytT family response regulator